VTFWRLNSQHYLTAGRNGSGYKIVKAWKWELYRLDNIENEQSAEKLGEFDRLNDAKAFAKEHNAKIAEDAECPIAP
jgi:hypothetical protein